MPVSEDDVRTMIAAARQRVAQNWRPKGSNLNALIAGDVRPLTTGAADMYLAFYAWLWGTETSPEDREWVVSRLRNVPVDADWSLRDRVLTTCAVWSQIQELSQQDQARIRSILGKGAEPGSYPELSLPASPQDGSRDTVEEAMERSAARHTVFMDLLRG